MSITGFSMADNQKAERKLIATYVDVGTSTPPEWEILGAGVEDSSIEYNPDSATVTDILGITETTVNKFEEKQSFDPNELRGGQKLNYKLLDIVRRRAYSELANFTVLRAYKILSETANNTTTIEAEKDTGCTITPQSLGGSSYIGMPIDVNFSGNRTFGTVDSLTNPSFTPTVSA